MSDRTDTQDRDAAADPARAGAGRCVRHGRADGRLRHRQDDQSGAAPYGLADAEAFIEKVQDNDPDRDCNFLIEHEDHGLVGGLGFFTPPGEPLEVGYWIGRAWWGRGFASEALGGALSWARNGWKKRYVTAGHFADNPASGAVLCKAGFLYPGRVAEKHSLARGAPAATRLMVWLA